MWLWPDINIAPRPVWWRGCGLSACDMHGYGRPDIAPV